MQNRPHCKTFNGNYIHEDRVLITKNTEDTGLLECNFDLTIFLHVLP